MSDSRTAEDVRREPRPLGWLFARHRKPQRICWIVATPDGEQRAHDSERAAERAAGELVKSRRATEAVVYRINYEGDL